MKDYANIQYYVFAFIDFQKKGLLILLYVYV